jgi:TolB protein
LSTAAETVTAPTHTPLSAGLSVAVTPNDTPASLAWPTPTQTPAVPSPVPSPDGLRYDPAGKIVFTCKPEEFNQLCIMEADGSDQQRLTNRRADDYDPAFGPGSRSVVYVSNRSGRSEIYLYDLKSRFEQQVTPEIGKISAPQVSPDGGWIVFASQATDSMIWLIRTDGSLPRPITDAAWDEIDPSWSPDGSQIAFAGVRGGFVELFVMDADGENVRQVTNDLKGIGGPTSWSPDGRYLAFYAGPRGDRDIYILEISSGQVRRLTSGDNNLDPSFSPEGMWIAFSSSRDGDHEIYIMRLDGSEIRQLTDNSYDDWQPDWGQ